MSQLLIYKTYTFFFEINIYYSDRKASTGLDIAVFNP